jgi:integrase
MKLEELKDNREMKRWFRDTNAAPATQHNFYHAMSQYTEFLNMPPEELLDEAENEMGLSARKRQLKDHILDFREHLQKRGVADSTIKNRIASIRSFYVSNEILFPKIRGEKSTSIKENQAVPTKEDLQDCIAVCDPLERAVMLAGISSGLAANEIRNIKLQQFKDGYDPKTEITTLKLRRGKTDVDFITFFSPEASRAIWDYLEFRDRPLKAVGSRRKQQVEKQRTTPDSYLFILQGVCQEYIQNHDEEHRKMTEDAIIKLYRRVSEKARKNTKHAAYNYIRSHTMRKYFNSALLNAGCDSFHVEFWMGHQLDDTKAAYFRGNPIALREIYQKYIPYLIIQKELNVAESPEFQKLKEENEILTRETVKATVEREEIKRINADFTNYKNEMEIKSEIERNKHSIQLLKMQKKIEPEKANEIQKMIDGLQNVTDHLHNKLYKEYEKYR